MGGFNQVMDQNCNFSWESGCKKYWKKNNPLVFLIFQKRRTNPHEFQSAFSQLLYRVANQTGIDQRHVEAHKTICKGK
jgi:hypothetical protein